MKGPERHDDRFDDFFRRMFPSAARAAAMVIGDPGIGAQVAQETMLRVYQKWSSYSDEIHARNSMYKILMNLARDHLRKERWTFTSQNPYSLVQVSADITDVDERLLIQEAMSQLSPRQRLALVLVDFLGLTSEEAASIMGGSPSTVRVQLMRGRKSMRESLRDSTEGGRAS